MQNKHTQNSDFAAWHASCRSTSTISAYFACRTATRSDPNFGFACIHIQLQTLRTALRCHIVDYWCPLNVPNNFDIGKVSDSRAGSHVLRIHKWRVSAMCPTRLVVHAVHGCSICRAEAYSIVRATQVRFFVWSQFRATKTYTCFKQVPEGTAQQPPPQTRVLGFRSRIDTISFYSWRFRRNRTAYVPFGRAASTALCRSLLMRIIFAWSKLWSTAPFALVSGQTCFCFSPFHTSSRSMIAISEWTP